MAKPKNFRVIQVCLGSTSLHKFLCDIEQEESKASRKGADIIKNYYKDKIPFGWEEYKKKNNL
jgi:hypothetical protein|tara:strand:- start:113 stop:301 length:189 start_codon:yes stop_codon:yes gene_type:complete